MTITTKEKRFVNLIVKTTDAGNLLSTANRRRWGCNR